MATLTTAGPIGFRHRTPYKWVALTNTTLGVLMATVNSSIVIISLPAIFNGIGLDPLAPGNVAYLLWILMAYMLVTAVLVVTLGRLGDIYGRVRIYNAGFAVFAVASLALALTPLGGESGAVWLIAWRVVQGIGGAMLMANSTAIITDAFPPHQRGMAVGINQVAALAGSFVGLVTGGLLSEWNWRAVFWVSVPLGVLGTVWAYRSLRETAVRRAARIDWWGNLTFGTGLTVLLAGITFGIQPYGGHTQGWTNPWVLAGLIGGLGSLVAFVALERRVSQPMFHLELFRIQAFWTGNLAALLASIARGGLQFMLIIWLQGIWLPLHGYDFAETPLWAGVYLLPLTLGFLVAGPLAGSLSDRFGARYFTTGGMLLSAATFVGLLLLPADFSYTAFGLLIALNGVGAGLFTAPNTTAIMNAVPAHQRGASAGMAATFQNTGMVLSMGVFFSLLIAGLADTLPGALRDGLTAQGVPAAAAGAVAGLPPVGTVFAAFLGFNPVAQLLGSTGVLDVLPPAAVATLTGTEFFPHLLAGPFQHGLVIVFALAAAMSVVGALVSAGRGRRYVHVDLVAEPSPERETMVR
jgi:MFS family permease